MENMHQFGSFRLSCQALFSTREILARKLLQTRMQAILRYRPIKHEQINYDIAHPPGAQRPGLIINPSTDMAWRPYANLIDGELNNSTPGKVTGWMRFFRRGMTPLRVTFDLVGDFHEDIHGKRIRLTNPQPSDENIALDRQGTYMEKFAPVQSGVAGDITAGLPLGTWSEELAQRLMAQNEVVWNEIGLPVAEREQRRKMWAERYRGHIAAGDRYFAYVEYPYIEWYSDNGRVVLELDPLQVEVLDQEGHPMRRDTPRELHPVKNETAMIEAFENVLNAGLRREGERRDKRTSRKR
jgi:hypothetical protein